MKSGKSPFGIGFNFFYALKYLKNEIKGNETILFKGSQYLEGIIADLLEDKSNIKNLPRQDEAAKKRRAKWGLK